MSAASGRSVTRRPRKALPACEAFRSRRVVRGRRTGDGPDETCSRASHRARPRARIASPLAPSWMAGRSSAGDRALHRSRVRMFAVTALSARARDFGSRRTSPIRFTSAFTAETASSHGWSGINCSRPRRGSTALSLAPTAAASCRTSARRSWKCAVRIFCRVRELPRSRRRQVLVVEPHKATPCRHHIVERRL